jgi:hypothetical protein
VQALYPNNQFIERPSGMKVVVRPNRHTPGRGHIIVFNWSQASEARVDVTALGLPTGAAFEIRDVRDLRAEPVAAGRYRGTPIEVPLQGVAPAPVVGWKNTPVSIAPEFGVFLVTSSSAPPSTFAAMVARVRGLIGF